MKFKRGDIIIKNSLCPKSLYQKLKKDTPYTILRDINVGGSINVYEMKEIRENFCSVTFSQENIDKYFDLFDINHARALKVKKLKESLNENSKTNKNI